MTTVQVVTLIAAAAFGGGGVTAIIIKLLSRDTDQAAAESTHSDRREQDINNLRAIIAEVRDSEARKSARIDSLEQRLERLEERERHMLTRAAVHEAWDQLAFQRIVLGDEHFPPPPPLTARNDGLKDDGRPD